MKNYSKIAVFLFIVAETAISPLAFAGDDNGLIQGAAEALNRTEQSIALNQQALQQAYRSGDRRSIYTAQQSLRSSQADYNQQLQTLRTYQSQYEGLNTQTYGGNTYRRAYYPQANWQPRNNWKNNWQSRANWQPKNWNHHDNGRRWDRG